MMSKPKARGKSFRDEKLADEMKSMSESNVGHTVSSAANCGGFYDNHSRRIIP